jgi:hypothetical protein
MATLDAADPEGRVDVGGPLGVPERVHDRRRGAGGYFGHDDYGLSTTSDGRVLLRASPFSGVIATLE